MAVHYRTRGFFIKKTDRGEDSESFAVYTEDFGKLDILAKAVRKIKSKLRSGAELFYLSEIEFIQGKGRKTLTDAILIDKFPNIRKDLKRLSVTRQITGVLDTLVSKEEKDKQIWGLLQEVFGKLNLSEISGSTLKILYDYFFWHLVSSLGYKPELTERAVGACPVDADVAKILKVIFRKDWPLLSRLKITPSHQKLLKNAAKCYTEAISA